MATYQHINTLLRELHRGVLELGIGKCKVTPLDRPEMTPAHFGFELSSPHSTQPFLIGVMRFGFASRLELPLAVAQTFLEDQGRARIARLLEQGTPPRALEAALLNPPPVPQPC